MKSLGKRVVLIGAALLVTACATARPTIVVAEKDTRLRWESDTVGYRPHPITGRTQEIRREELLREYWVKSNDGKWYRVPRGDWEMALVGQPLTVRPALGEPVSDYPGFGTCIGVDSRWRC